MYLSWDSEIYTSEGWIKIIELFERSERSQDILVACCNIVGKIYWSTTRITIKSHPTDETRNSQNDRKYPENEENRCLINGLVNCQSGPIYEWLPATQDSVGRMISFKNSDTLKEGELPYIVEDVDLPVGKSYKLPDYELNEKDYYHTVSDVEGLPIGTIVDGMSIYPSNINDKVKQPRDVHNYPFRRNIIYPFIPISKELFEKQDKLITEAQDLFQRSAGNSPEISRTPSERSRSGESSEFTSERSSSGSRSDERSSTETSKYDQSGSSDEEFSEVSGGLII